jgi:hypothetical protein
MNEWESRQGSVENEANVKGIRASACGRNFDLCLLRSSLKRQMTRALLLGFWGGF